MEGRYLNIMKDEITEESLDRLIQSPVDSHPIIKKKLVEFRNFLPNMEAEYKKNLIRINAEEASDRVFANFCEAIENSL